jgi:hypothetical protein
MMINSDGSPRASMSILGIIIFVPARVHNSFHEITERLAILVFFGASRRSLRPGRAGTDDPRLSGIIA